jgi:hypothetical protein
MPHPAKPNKLNKNTFFRNPIASPDRNRIWPLETTERKISNEIIANFSIVYRILLRN